MLFRQLFDAETCTYSYLLADTQSKEAVLIDSVYEQAERDSKLIQQLDLNLIYLLETHIHADHITGSALLKAKFPLAKTVVSAAARVNCADCLVQDGDSLRFGQYEIQVLATPGHTNSCLSFYCEGKVFTGDALLIQGCGRTDFQEGDAGRLYDSVTQKLFSLSPDTMVYPGHNYIGLTVSSIAEEQKLNPRLAHKSRDEFIEFMHNLCLDYPKKIDIAVPANLQCGQINKTKEAQI